MDNLGNSNNRPIDNIDKPIPFDDGSAESTPASAKPAGGSPGVSRAPLNLGGGGGSAPAPAPRPAARPAAKPAPRPAPKPVARAAAPQPVARQPVGVPGLGSGARITSCKVFFAKLHAGALDFLSDQISTWLKDNPNIQIKHTNVAVGDVQAKKTEPNILITVWY
jgi:hypothetical protein